MPKPRIENEGHHFAGMRKLQIRFKVMGLATSFTLILMLKDSVLSSHQSIRYSGPLNPALLSDAGQHVFLSMSNHSPFPLSLCVH